MSGTGLPRNQLIKIIVYESFGSFARSSGCSERLTLFLIEKLIKFVSTKT